MKKFLVCLSLVLFAVACSSDHDEVLPEEPSQSPLTEISFTVSSLDSVVVGDSILQDGVKTRVWDSEISIPAMYLISDVDGQRHTLQIKYSQAYDSTDWIIYFCLSVQNGKVYASYDGKSIPLDDACILSTVPGGEAVSIPNDVVTTPAGHPTREPYGDQLFRSAKFSFDYEVRRRYREWEYTYFINYQKVNYSNESGYFRPEGKRYAEPLYIKMNRQTTKIKANVIIVDSDFGHFLGAALSKSTFERTTKTDLEQWTLQTYLKNTPESYNVIDKGFPEGNQIVALMEEPIEFEDEQTTYFEGGALRYEGIGYIYEDEDEGYSHVFPMSIDAAKLCYSFYYTQEGYPVPRGVKYRKFNTLEVPLKDIKLESNVENEITTYFFLQDFITAMKAPSSAQHEKDSRSLGELHEDPAFGVVMDIPYKVKVTHKPY